MASLTSSGQYVAEQVLKGHTRAVASVKYSPDGTMLASASADASVRLWRSLGGGESVRTVVGHEQGLSDVCWSADSRFLATASDDKTAKVWDTETGAALLTLKGHSSYVFCANFSPHSNLLATGSFDENVKLWDVRSGVCLRTLPAHSDPVTSVDFNPIDGTCVVSGSHDGLIRVWDTGTGECLKTIFAEGNPPVSFVRYTPNGRFLLAGTLDDTVRIWGLVAHPHTRCLKTYRGHSSERFCVTTAVSCWDEGEHVVSGSEDHSVYLWGLQDRQIKQKLEGHTDTVLSVACHPFDKCIASAGSCLDKTVRTWRYESSAREDDHDCNGRGDEHGDSSCVLGQKRKAGADGGGGDGGEADGTLPMVLPP